jgi:hypothetical protein
MEPRWYYIAVGIWALVGIITFFYLYKQTAPYGRHTAAGWGPMISNRLGWMIMEGLSPLFISFWFWYGSSPKSYMDYTIYALYTGHYVYRGYIFPFLTRTKGKKCLFRSCFLPCFLIW